MNKQCRYFYVKPRKMHVSFVDVRNFHSPCFTTHFSLDGPTHGIRHSVDDTSCTIITTTFFFISQGLVVSLAFLAPSSSWWTAGGPVIKIYIKESCNKDI